MDILKEMIRSSGWLFGGAMLLSGLVALILCARASWGVRAARARRAAMIASLVPLLLAFIAVPVGAVFMWRASQRGLDVSDDWRYLGYIILYGLAFSAVPMLWSALLRRWPAS